MKEQKDIPVEELLKRYGIKYTHASKEEAKTSNESLKTMLKELGYQISDAEKE